MLSKERLLSCINLAGSQEQLLGSLDIAYQSDNSRIYRLWDDASPYILKVVKPNSRHDREVGGMPLEKVDQLIIVNNLLKKYYGNVFVCAHYVLFDQLTPPQIASIRPEIIGTPADQLPQFSAARLEVFSRKTEWDNRWFEVTSDYQFSQLHPVTKRGLFAPDFSLGNIVFVYPDSYFIIDW